MSTSAHILEHALMDDGLAEVPGKKSNPRIKRAINLAADWLDDDDSVTAWCGCIRGLWGFETATGVPPARYRAKSWLGLGAPVKLDEASPGDTVILKRSGGHHVALFRWFKNGGIYLFGGNQSNAANTKKFALADVVGVKRAL